MKSFAKLICVLLIAALCLTAPALAAGQVTTTASVNLRSGAGLGYQSLRVIGEGVTLSYTETAWDSRGVLWYHVSYSGSNGWVSSRYAKEGGSAGSSVTTTANVHLRAGAGTEYESLRTIGRGTTLTWDRTAYDSKGVAWYHVSHNGWTGWVCAKYVRQGGGSGGGSSSGSGKVTTTGSVHMRAGAGLNYAALLTIEKGVTLTWDKTSTDSRGVAWYRVSYRGKTGWISSKYAKKGGSSGGSSSGGSSSSTSISGMRVVGDSGKSNVHTGPGLAYETLGVLHVGEYATYLNATSVDDRGVVWFKISWKGREAWVSSRYTLLTQ